MNTWKESFGYLSARPRSKSNAHRMLPGHRIGIHTDTPNHGTETHRFLINLNAGFDDSYGGHLVLFDKDNLCEDALVVLPPGHNSAAAMEFSDRSWHWVDEVKSGMRFSLVYSFWKESAVESRFHVSLMFPNRHLFRLGARLRPAGVLSLLGRSVKKTNDPAESVSC